MVIALNIVDLYIVAYLFLLCSGVVYATVRVMSKHAVRRGEVKQVVSAYRYDRCRVVGSKRGTVGTFSRQAVLRYLLFALLNVERLEAYLTLTTRVVLSTKRFKIALNLFLESLKAYNIAALWVVEQQERGALHTHMLLTSNLDYRVVSSLWSLAQKRFTGEDIAGTCSHIKPFVRDHVFYLCKYLSKNYGFVGRRWGYSCRGLWQLPQQIRFELQVGAQNRAYSEYSEWLDIKNGVKALDCGSFESPIRDYVESERKDVLKILLSEYPLEKVLL
jgi:hypothetical protein